MYIQERFNTNGTLGANAKYYDTIKVQTNYPIGTGYNGGSANIPPFWTTGYDTNRSQIYPLIKSKYNYSPLPGPTTIHFEHVLSYSNDFIPANDTLRFDQIFSDYYAYDDGTAEAAYFINGLTPMYLAYQFTLNNPDTLRGLLLDFNYLFVNQANYAFRLALWDNSGPGGSPGNMKFEDDQIYSPKFTDSVNNRNHDSLNGFTFYPYHFSHDSAVSGTFYVGWVQTYGDSLNIGYDYNTDHHDKIYYNVGSGWTPGTYPGSMMMRPVFGKSNSHEPSRHSDLSANNVAYEALSIYPNPAKDLVSLSIPMPVNTVLKIYTADGREWMNNSNFYGNSINTSTLPAGFYIVEVTTAAGKAYYQKLLIQR